jgi:protein Tex
MIADLSLRVAEQLALPPHQVSAALELFAQGATVPFVARYRKEVTGGLDEVQLRAIAERHERLRELDTRRAAILAGLQELGKWTEALDAQLAACTTRAELEELWAPYKKRRTTRADQARARGLQPLADRILAQPDRTDVLAEARSFVSSEVPDVEAALAGAQDIVAETLANRPEIASAVRQGMREHGVLTTRVKKGATDPDRFRDYADHQEPLARMASHRYLAVCRGEDEGVLSVSVTLDPERTAENVLRRVPYKPNSPFGPVLRAAVEDAVPRLILPAAERAARSQMAAVAEEDALDVFQRNLEALLLAAPLGPADVLGIDPGLRTGCKCALVTATGELREHRVLPLVGGSRRELVDWLKRARPRALAVGNGTGGREALHAAREATKEAGVDSLVVSVSEAGASVYSASDAAREELPDVDLTVRSAVHIARRLQDPLAELVKVPPQSLGVGQYQHDVDEARLARRLNDVVESCVNRVGVDVNTASPALLAYVAGIGPKLAAAIVRHRQEHGPFRRRAALLDVPGLGKKTFEQCAGFLRVRGDDPLDASGVHPERYALVARMARELGLAVTELVGNAQAVGRIALSRYQDADTGLATLQDIAAELQRPGRDPRDGFEAPAFRDDVREIGDLEVGMVLQGVVTNVTSFGAFVDIGVHQDGLVHVSELSDRFVRAPHEVVSPGQALEVRVLAVDGPRKRISLSAKKAR